MGTTATASTTEKRLCPRCGTAQLHRSQMRGLIERGILRPVGFRAYRCASCDGRFLQFGGRGKQANSGATVEKTR